MKNLLLITLSVFILLSSCSKDVDRPDSEQKLTERFQGRYKPVSSISREFVDINADGKSSNDILSEMPELNDSFLEIRLYNKVRLINIFWNEQFVYTYDPPVKPVVMYARQATGGNFRFIDNMSAIEIESIKNNVDPERYVLPESVKIKSDDLIEVILNKRIYTKNGWQIVHVTTLYQRYQKEV